MDQNISRRNALEAMVGISGTILSTGCISDSSGSDGRESGDLIIENMDSKSHTATVIVKRVSESNDDDRGPEFAPTPDATPLSERRESFSISEGETLQSDRFLTESGTYFVQAQLNDGTTARGWVGVDGEFVEILINADSSLDVFGQTVGD